MTDEETIQKLLDLKLAHHGPGLPRPARGAARQPALLHREDRRSWSIASGPIETTAGWRACCAPRDLTINDASLENVWCEPGRGLDKAVIRDLATCQWIRKKHNVIVVGKTGVGKSYLGAALAQAACRNGLRALCTRVPRLAARARDRARRRYLHRDCSPASPSSTSSSSTTS